MRNGRVRAGARNRVERQVPQKVRFLADRLELVRRRHLAEPALRRLRVEPGEEARQRRTVPAMRGPRALHFRFVLHRLCKDAGVARLDDLRAGVLERLEDRGDGRAWIDVDRLAAGAELRECRGEFGPRAHCDVRPEVRTHLVGDLPEIGEQLGAPVGEDDGEGKRDGGARNVAAANVEQPRDRIERRDDDRARLLFCKPLGDLAPLVRRRAAGHFLAVHLELVLRGGRAAGPDAVDRIGVHGDELGPVRGELCRRIAHLLAGVQPRIVSELRTALEIVGDPLIGRTLHQMLDRK